MELMSHIECLQVALNIDFSKRDNTDSRLSEIGRSLGVVGEHRGLHLVKNEKIKFEKRN